MAKENTSLAQMIAHIDHPSGFFALSDRNQAFTADGLAGFISFRAQGRHLVCTGGVHAPPAARGELLDAFLEETTRRRQRPLIVQLPVDQVELFEQRDFTVNQFGSTFGVGLDGYKFSGGRKIKLRNKLKRARSVGVQIKEIGRDMPSTAATWEMLKDISAEWLRAKKKKELDFMIGELQGRGEDLRRIFVTFDADGRGVGYITYVPVWGRRPGFLHDLTRRRVEAPVGAMELCNAVAMERMIDEGVRWLHFGFTPFIVGGPEPASSSRVLAWCTRKLRSHGAWIYPAETQVAYKLKWCPDFEDREYIAGRPLGLRAILDLLVLTRSI